MHQPPDTANEEPPLQTLASTFGSEFTLWVRDVAANEAPRNGGRPEAVWSCRGELSRQFDAARREQTFAALEELASIQRPVTRNLGDGSLLLAVPIAMNGPTLSAAVGTCSADAGRLAGQLAACSIAARGKAVEPPRNQSDLRPFIERLTDNNEELTWLRALVENLKFCTASHGVYEVAERMFPALGELLRAESIAFVRRAETEWDSEVGERGFEFPVWCGRETADRASCCEFLTTVLRNHADRPYVWNAGSFSGDTRCAPMTSCVVVPVASENHRFGWLVAMNRLPRTVVNGRDASARLGDDEFGSVEASLLDSTARMLATHAANISLWNEQRNLVVNVIRALINVVDARDSYTCGHSDRVALMGRHLACCLGLDSRQQEYIYLAGLLHDVGKVGVADDILLKPGPLTDEEFEQIRQHPERGKRFLERFPQFQPILPGVLHHHESYDGGGYPSGLAGASIPLMARILAVVDAYDALTTSRPYRSAKPHAAAVEILRNGAGRQWDPRIVDAFLSDIGSFRRLSDQWESDLAGILDGDDHVFDDLREAIDESLCVGGTVVV